MARPAFLLRVLRAYATGEDDACPHCESDATETVLRKYGLLQLRRCTSCKLMYRWPKQGVKENLAFYQDSYRQGDLTTDMPSSDVLAALVACNFRGTRKDLGPKISVLRSLRRGGRLLEFGCSWGYGAIQLARAGYDVVGFEVSRRRAVYGRGRLGLTILDRYAELDGMEPGSFDIVFANHTFEHLPTPRLAFARLERLLVPGGVLLAFVPDAGGEQARRLGAAWGPLLCETHTLALDAAFVERALPAFGVEVSTTSFGEELMIVGRRVAAGQQPAVGA